MKTTPTTGGEGPQAIALPKLPAHVGEESHGTSQTPVKLYDADQMNAHYLLGVEAGRAAASGQAGCNVDYSTLESPLEDLINYCNNDDMLSNASEVIAAEAALEMVYKARLAAIAAGAQP